jgi:hypothetical protein
MKIPFFKGDRWDIENVNPPWGDRPSIYEHILKNLRPGEPGLGEKGDLLPDEEIVIAGKGLPWALGALDGVLGHHLANSKDSEAANKVLESLRAFIKKATDERASSLYSLLLEQSALAYVDQLLEAVSGADDLDVERMHAIAHWLAIGAADREPIKFAIALLGVCHGSDDRDLLLTLGRLEKFTLFASVALRNSSDDPELSLWALGCLVNGWGRIQIIERLAETKDEQIKAWMLREGYENEIMQEYTALICATTGDLLSALRKPLPLAYRVTWCPRRDSNPEPTDYESAALTVELQGHRWTLCSRFARKSASDCNQFVTDYQKALRRRFQTPDVLGMFSPGAELPMP